MYLRNNRIINIFKNILFKNKIQISQSIVYKKKKNIYYDSVAQITFKDKLILQ